jgi:D-beta-D-heptose 7-phosphate kinase / D-beta-D-heptose 1-phosphate adenosyltransferase
MKNPTIVYTAGVWDILHRGHLNLLWQSKKLGDVLVVGVVGDVGVRAYKARRPEEALFYRLQRIQRIPWVDVAIEQASTDPTENLRRFLPDIFTHGSDWDRLKQGHETLEELGIEYVTIPYTKEISTTILRSRNG